MRVKDKSKLIFYHRGRRGTQRRANREKRFLGEAKARAKTKPICTTEDADKVPEFLREEGKKEKTWIFFCVKKPVTALPIHDLRSFRF